MSQTLPQDIWSVIIDNTKEISTLAKVSRLNQTFFKATKNKLDMLKKEYAMNILQTGQNAFCELFNSDSQSYDSKKQHTISLQPKFSAAFNYLADLEPDCQCRVFLTVQEILKICHGSRFLLPNYEEESNEICNFLIPLLKNKFILASEYGFSFFVGLMDKNFCSTSLQQSFIKSMVLKELYLNALEGNRYPPKVNEKIFFEISIINQLHRVLSEDLFSLTDKTDFITHKNKVIYIQDILFDEFYKNNYLKLSTNEEVKIDSLFKALKRNAKQLYEEILAKLIDLLIEKKPSESTKHKCIMQ